MTIKVVNKYHESYDIYIGRGSKWGNPYIVGIDGTREQCINKYTDYLLDNDDLFNDLKELKDKRLGCFCKPQSCHGDILKYYAELD